MRQSQNVAQQLFALKTTINHLKNAYNGNDVEWADNGECLMTFGRKNAIFIKLFSITDDSEEPEPESGSGSGSGIDDSDDEDGSGEFLIIFIRILNLN